MNKLEYTIQKDVAYIVRENGAPVAVVLNDQKARLNVVCPIGRPMSGMALGEFLSKIMPLPKEFIKGDLSTE